MNQLLNDIFIEARTHYTWQKKPVDDSIIKKIYDLAKLGPTSANCQPLRIIFIKSELEKNKLKECLAPGNIDKTMSAPITAIFAYDTKFYDHLPKLFPHVDAKSWFVGNEELINNTAKLNSALQAAYFIIAARALAVDCGPMSGFNSEVCDKIFLQESNFKSFLLCNLGYGEPSTSFNRLPRYAFKDICKIL